MDRYMGEEDGSRDSGAQEVRPVDQAARAKTSLRWMRRRETLRGLFFFIRTSMPALSASSSPSFLERANTVLVDNPILAAVSSSVQPAILSSSIRRSSSGRPSSHRFRLIAPKIRWCAGSTSGLD